MIAYEKVLLEAKPDFIVVVGDVNSTVTATLAASKLGIKVAHLEAGLRSFDRTMPEEINRIVTDSLADLLWTPSPDADENLIKEGILKEKIDRVGNIMIDSLEMLRSRIEKEATYREFNLNPSEYGVVTLYRPSNVDSPNVLSDICHALIKISEKISLVFPVHPRTRKNLEAFGLLKEIEQEEKLYLTQPLSYLPFMNLVFNCCLVLTDSGGLQEETTYLGIPCITIRPNTERPITIHQGTNRLCDYKNITDKVNKVLNTHRSTRPVPEFWDGQTASRVVKSVMNFL